MTPQDLQFATDHIERLVDRRQTMTSFYLSVNAAIFAAVGFLVKDVQMGTQWLVAVLALLSIAGLTACWIWRRLLRQYATLLKWWYAQVRELEQGMPDSASLVTREYEELYGGGKTKAAVLGMTRHEIALNNVFIGLYLACAIGILLNALL